MEKKLTKGDIPMHKGVGMYKLNFNYKNSIF